MSLAEAAMKQNETIRRMTELLAGAARPKLIILFGSRARGDATEGIRPVNPSFPC